MGGSKHYKSTRVPTSKKYLSMNEKKKKTGPTLTILITQYTAKILLPKSVIRPLKVRKYWAALRSSRRFSRLTVMSCSKTWRARSS